MMRVVEAYFIGLYVTRTIRDSVVLRTSIFAGPHPKDPPTGVDPKNAGHRVNCV